jgi:hypothetical protein
MEQPPHAAYVAAHITSVRTRTSIHTTALTAALVRQSWPAGIADRTEPAALAWVKRAGPRLLGPLPSACSCAGGHCLVCN